MSIRNLLQKLYFKYTYLFLLCIGVIFIFFPLKRASLIGDGDSFNQLYPAFIYVGKYFRDLLQGAAPQFDFRLGLGEDVISTLSSYGLGDPLSIIGAIVPLKYSEAAYGAVMLIKYYLCGAAFITYAKRYVTTHNFLLAGALMYALSVYALFRGLGFWMFINPMIYFPLILTGIDELLRKEKRISWVLIFSLFIQTLNGFYYLYMNIILAVIYYLIMGLGDNFGKDKAYWVFWLQNAVVTGIQAILGIGLGAVSLLPSILGYLNSSRTGRAVIFEKISDAFMFDVSFYLNNLKCLLVPGIWESIMTIPLVVLAGIIIVFTTRQVHTPFKQLTILFIILFGIPAVGSLFNGFSDSTDRWYYAVSFWGIMLSLVVMERYVLNKKQSYLFILVSMAAVLFNLLLSGINVGSVFRSIGFGILILLLPYAWNHKKREQLLLAAVCLMTMFNGWLVFAPHVLGGSGYTWGFEAKNTVLNSMEASKAQITVNEDKVFERFDLYDSSLAAALATDYYGTTEYFSILNSYVSEFYQALCISPGVRSATWILKGLDGRAEILSLLSVSQYMDFHTRNGEAESYVKENEAYLPLGFTYDGWISREDFDSLNAVQKQESLLHSVILDAPVENIAQTEITGADSNRELEYFMEYENIEMGEDGFRVNTESRIRVYLADAAKLENVYIQFCDFKVLTGGVHEMLVGNKNLQLRNENDPYFMGDNEFLVNVTELFEENGRKYFDIIFWEDSQFSLGEIKLYGHEINPDIVEARRANALEAVTIEKDKIRGSIELEESGLLFFSIPYSKGWRGFVDGKETEVLKANVGFLALEIGEGKHEVQLLYETPGLKAGMLCSMISLVSLAAIFGYEKKRRHNSF